jgi:serine/threonine-protein kinase
MAQKFAQSVQGRLPTEAEWEFAARSGGYQLRWAGKNRAANNSFPKARLLSLENGGEPYPVPVKSFPGEDETDQKVFDMTGNVREWCLDVYSTYPVIISQRKKGDQPLHDPCEGVEPEPGNLKLEYVVRGGSFLDTPDDAKTYQRDGLAADSQCNFLGFRIVIQCPPEIGDPSQ